MAKSRVNRASPPRRYEVLFQMVIGKWISQALGTIVEIGVPDQLAKGTRRCSEIAREAGVSEDGIYRLLRALASLGLFVESADRRFKLTGMGQLLRSGHPESLAGYARFVAHDSTWRPWGQLGYSVKTGMPAFDHVFGAPILEYLSKNPEVAAVFDDAMTSISAPEAHATSDAYDFKGIKTLMDVAGGHGLLLATVLRRHKTVIMKHIVHNWDDDSATRILQTCHRALGPRGKVLVVIPSCPPVTYRIMANCSISRCWCLRPAAGTGRRPNSPGSCAARDSGCRASSQRRVHYRSSKP